MAHPNDTGVPNRLQQTEQLTGPWQTAGRAIEVGGLAGWEIEGEATDKQSGRRVKVYQLIARDEPRHYFIVQGLVSPAGWDVWLPRFRAVAQSLRGHKAEVPASPPR